MFPQLFALFQILFLLLLEILLPQERFAVGLDDTRGYKWRTFTVIL
jgi:hypothetical protein